MKEPRLFEGVSACAENHGPYPWVNAYAHWLGHSPSEAGDGGGNRTAYAYDEAGDILTVRATGTVEQFTPVN